MLTTVPTASISGARPRACIRKIGASVASQRAPACSTITWTCGLDHSIMATGPVIVNTLPAS